MEELMKIGVISIVLYDLRHPRTLVWLLAFTYKSGTRFKFVLIDYAKQLQLFAKVASLLAESASIPRRKYK